MCISGSVRCSTTLRSSSVSSPVTTRLIGLPKARDRSRTSRAIFWKVGWIGTMRIAIVSRCSVAGDAAHVGQAPRQPLVAGVEQRRLGGEDRLRDHQLADHLDQLVELAGPDLDRAVRLVPARHRQRLVRHRGGEQRPPWERRAPPAAGRCAPSGRAAGRRRRSPAAPAARAGSSVTICGQQVHRLQHQVDLALAHRVLAGARQVEQRLDLVRELLDRRDPEHAGVALDGVKRPEDLVDERQVAGRRLEPQDRPSIVPSWSRRVGR